MKQMIELFGLVPLTAVSVALYGAYRGTHATQTAHNQYFKKPALALAQPGDLVLLGLDGTVIAREVNLAPQEA